MYVLSIISFLLLAGFLLLAAMRFGIPDMMSDLYYQLQNCTGSEVIGDKRKRNYGWVFTAVMVASSLLMLIPLLDCGMGIQCLAFLGCAGLMFVGAAPNYIDKDTLPIHKCGAIVAAIGCVGWCMSVNILPTILLATFLFFVLWLFYHLFVKWEQYLAERDGREPEMHLHPWYWIEIAGFLDVYLTYWLCVC